MSVLTVGGIVVTASGEAVGFVSRTFYPEKTITEDPVTGASHAALVPFWAHKLKKQKLQARQVSSRGGLLDCEYIDGVVKLTGECYLYMSGKINA